MEEKSNREQDTDKETFTLGAGYQKSEALVLAEKIYDCKNEKKDLELQLSTEEFHFKYILVRKKRVTDQVVSRIKYILPLSFMLIACLVLLFYGSIKVKELRSSGAAESMSGARELSMSSIVILFMLLFLIFGGYIFIKLFLIPEIRQVKLLWNSRNTEKAMQKAKLKGLDTFQKDYDESNRKINYIKERIEQLTKEIDELTKKQNEMLYHKPKAEERLRKEDILFDVSPDETKNTGKFTLKKEDSQTADMTMLYEYYRQKEQYYIQYVTKLDMKITQVNKEIQSIDAEFEQSKKSLILFGIVFLLLIVIQKAFTGALAGLTSVFCLVISTIAIIYLETKCSPAIIRYLVEQEKEFFREYALIHNMVPVKHQRSALLEEKKKCEDMVNDLKEQTKNLL